MNFEEYLRLMFDKNCSERRKWGDEPYKSVSDYFESNHSFLVRKFREAYPCQSEQETL